MIKLIQNISPLRWLFVFAMFVAPDRINAQHCFPVSVPYVEDFNTVRVPALPVCTEVRDLDGDKIVWQTSSWMGTHLALSYEDGKSDDWFFTPGLQLHVDTIYTLQFAYTGWGSKGGKGEGIASMEIVMGTDKQKDSMLTRTPLFRRVDIVDDLNTMDTVIVHFMPSRTGVWYVAVHSFMEGKASLRIDDIAVRNAVSNHWKDVQLTAITHPATGAELCPDNSASVRVAVRNVGLDTLWAIPLHLHVAGITRSETLPGPLVPGAHDTVTISGADLSTAGVIDMKAYTSFGADEFSGNDSVSGAVTVVPPPQVGGIVATPTGELAYLFSAPNATDVASWEWDFGDGSTGVGEDPTHTYPSEGYFIVRLKGSNGCSWDTVSHLFEILDMPASVSEYVASGTVEMYPNPARGKVMVSTGNNTKADIVICNSMGSVVYQSVVPAAAQHEIITAGWAPGIYIVRMQTADTIWYRKLELVY